jgi:4-amino-4-deoxy-L-arabinose transferase-like glycosyltransferase
MPRYWRYLVAALVGLGAGAIFRGTIGVIIGGFVALTIILMIESRTAARSSPITVGWASVRECP